MLQIKYKADGTVEHYKARLVAKGFAQKLHLDYTETFAPVVKFASLWTIIAVAAMEDLELDSMDISSAFLNGDLEEEIFIRGPGGSDRIGYGCQSDWDGISCECNPYPRMAHPRIDRLSVDRYVNNIKQKKNPHIEAN